MRTKLSTGIAFVCLMAPAAVMAQEQKQQQCQFQGAPQLSVAQSFLQQARDTTLSQSERNAAAEKAWSQALEGPIQDDTDNHTFYYFGALASVQLGDYARTDSLLTAFLEKAPEGCEGRAEQVRRQAWAQLFNQAIEAYNAGDRTKALDRFEEANRMYTDSRSLVNAATLHQQVGNDERAMELYSRILEVGGEPQQMRTAVTNLATTRLQQGDTAAALTEYERYLSKNQGDAAVLATYAQTLSQTGRSDSARSIFGTLAQRDDLTFNQWSKIGVGAFQAGANQEAIRAFQKARGLRPLNKETMENLLSAYAQQERWEDIASLADTVISWYPYDAQNYQTAVRAYDNLKQSKRAQSLLDDLQAAPIQIARLGMTESDDGVYTIQGRFQTADAEAAGQEITIPFELLDRQGNVVATHEFTTTLPPEGENEQIRFQVTTDDDAATFRYAKDPAFGGDGSASGSGGGAGR